ncbi:nitrilase-related carbon-nitrogen hydrolase [Rhodococcus koreensis]|uniref:nitrilase-related carbon-nitrogen hydrolase n=1 Tax=Rhodococcus koreensis TaxID=99653 RepID=UPI00366D500B
MRIAVFQATSAVGRIDANLDALASAAAEAADGGADILVTPELFPTGYAPDRIHHLDGATVRQAVSTTAERSGIAVVASTVEQSDSGRFITATLFGADGTQVLHYRKSHLFGTEEAQFFTAGSALSSVVRFGDLSVALGICYDVEFPEYVRALAVAGADLMLVPTAVPARVSSTFDSAAVPGLIVPARALENTVAIAYANQCGTGFAGRSCIVAPDGSFAARAENEPTLIFADITSETIRGARADNPYLRSRRLDLY